MHLVTALLDAGRRTALLDAGRRTALLDAGRRSPKFLDTKKPPRKTRGLGLV
jgi:hypothetical protein